MTELVEASRVTTIMTRGAKPGPLHRVTADDSFAAREILKQAPYVLEPDNRTQRQLVSNLMPELFMLRSQGFSFNQLSTLLAEVGVKLQPGTLRVYYAEMLDERMDICQQRFNEHLLMLSEIKKVGAGQDVATIAAKAASITKERMSRETDRINGALGVKNGNAALTSKVTESGAASALRAEAAPREAIQLPRAEVRTVDHDEGSGEVLSDQFGLLKGSAPVTGQSFKNFLDDEPSIPSLEQTKPTTPLPATTTVIPPAAAQDKPTTGKNNLAASPPSLSGIPETWKCKPLKEGVRSLEQKTGVPDFVYKEGLLEHPAIPGLMLTMEERVYGTFLEIVDTTSGESRFEELKEKALRVLWRKKGTRVTGSTDNDFTLMNVELFSKQHQ